MSAAAALDKLRHMLKRESSSTQSSDAEGLPEGSLDGKPDGCSDGSLDGTSDG